MNIELCSQALPERLAAYLHEVLPSEVMNELEGQKQLAFVFIKQGEKLSKVIKRLMQLSKKYCAISCYADVIDCVEVQLNELYHIKETSQNKERKEILSAFSSLCQQGFFPEIKYFDTLDYEVLDLEMAVSRYYHKYEEVCKRDLNRFRATLETILEDSQIRVKRQSKVALMLWSVEYEACKTSDFDLQKEIS